MTPPEDGASIWLSATTTILAALQWIQPTPLTAGLGVAGAGLLIMSLCERQAERKKERGYKPKTNRAHRKDKKEIEIPESRKRTLEDT
jgi:hypothetical protein